MGTCTLQQTYHYANWINVGEVKLRDCAKSPVGKKGGRQIVFDVLPLIFLVDKHLLHRHFNVLSERLANVLFEVLKSFDDLLWASSSHFVHPNVPPSLYIPENYPLKSIP